MKTDAITAFITAIESTGLLDAARMAELRSLVPQFPDDAQSLAREIVNRGWFTAFQIKAIWKGESRELFIGPFVLLEKIGEGGMGEVFKARHRHMGRDVALKVIRREKLASPEAVRRFRQEMEAAARLSHPNVVMAYDADADGERHFVAMEFVDGLTITRLVRERGPLPIREACDYARQTALGLQHASEQGVVHRDIKPSNLLVATRTNQVKILDMGLAWVDSPSANGFDQSRITQEGLLVGTPDFIAPEQARNARKADIRADIYALGGTLFFMLTGQVPYPGGTSTEKLVRHATEPIPDVTRYRQDVPTMLLAIMAKLLAKKPEDRFQTPSEVAIALEPFCRSPGSGIISGASTMRMPVPLPPIPAADSITDSSQFRLPPPSTDGIRVPKMARTQWKNRTAFTIAGIAGVCVIGLTIWLLTTGKLQPSNAEEKIEARFDNDLKMTFVRIEPGRFRMGSPDNEPGRDASEGPQHEVEITRPFYAMTTEVTQGQYYKLTEKRPSAIQPPRDADLWPVEMVSWSDAVAFCTKLNETDSRKRTGFIYRLPTETEWEYLCRSGRSTRFCFGDKLASNRGVQFDASQASELIEGVGTKLKGPTKVARFPANEWGLYDTHGNVWEWCGDWFDDKCYSTSDANDPKGPSKGDRRVLRGGAWDSTASRCRSATRWAQPPDKKANNIGFRVVWGPE